MSTAAPDHDRFGPRRSDPNMPSAARVYDFLLGGDYNYESDQLAAARMMRDFPLLAQLARYNRLWVRRAVRHLIVDCGVTQFLDIGAGIPTAGNVHEVAESLAPTSRVVYVDYELVAVDIGREILDGNPRAASIHADMRLPDSILDHPETRQVLDFKQPMAAVFGSVLHFIEDRDDPHGILQRYKQLLKPGDYIAISCISEHFQSGKALEEFRALIARYNELVSEIATTRPLDQIERFFAGTEIIKPGLVPAPDWKPDIPGYEPDLHDVARTPMVAGLGRVTGQS